jgi:spermidine synthase
MAHTADFDARSLLFIPADAERFIAKGAGRGADVIILDLEDGVAPSTCASTTSPCCCPVTWRRQWPAAPTAS